MLEDLYPLAIKLGMTKSEFFHSTPKDFSIIVEAKNAEIREQQELEKLHVKQNEYYAWLTGFYVQLAIGASFGKNRTYPKEPLTNNKPKTIAEIAVENGKTEAELKSELMLAEIKVHEVNKRLEMNGLGQAN